MLSALQTALQKLNPRERQLVMGAACILIVAVVWSLHDWQAATRKKLATSLPAAQAQLVLMQTQAAELARLRSLTPPPPANLPQIKTQLEQSTRSQNLPLNFQNDSLQLNAKGEVTNFDNLINWLASQNNNGLRLTVIDYQKAGNTTLRWESGF